MAAIRSMYEMRQLYEAMKKRYFPGGVEGFRDLPPSKELRWYWLADNSDALGVTHWDDDGDPQDVGFSRLLRPSYHLTKHILLHEMTHMRLGHKVSCGGFSHAWTGPRIQRSGAWHAETIRLATAGAFQL